MVCSNQVRQNVDAGPYGQKWGTPGGQAFPFYSSVRLQCHNPEKIKRVRTVAGKDQTRVVGVTTEVQVVKNSVWKSYRSASVTILFDYGIDNIRGNLQYLRTNKGLRTYVVGENKLGNSLDDAISAVEEAHLQKQLASEVIDLWTEIEQKFNVKRDRQAKM